MSKLRKKFIGVALLLCLVLTGCSGRTSANYSDPDSDFEAVGVHDYSDMGFQTAEYVRDVTNKVSNVASNSVKGTVSDTVSGITAGVIKDIADEVEDGSDHLIKVKGNWGNQKKKTSSEQIIIKDVTAKSFKTEIDMGNVNVSYGKNDTATVKVKYTANGKNKDVLSEILQTVGIDYSMKEGTLQISVVNKNTKKNIWNWIRDKYNHYNDHDNYSLSVELDITLPESVNEFNIDNLLGEISLNSVKGVFNIDNSLGDIDLNNVIFTGQSKIVEDLGNIECSLSKDIKEKSKVTMDDSLGDIRIDTNSLSYTGDKEDDFDEYWDGSSSKSIIIKKLCEMDLNADLGEITIE